MQRFTVSRITFLLLGLATVAVAAGCVKKAPTEVEVTAMPEGTPAAGASLVVHAEVPTVLMDYIDRPPIGVDPGDSLVGTRSIYKNSPDANNLVLFDRTAASDFEALRREANGGWFSYKDFHYRPIRKWLDGKLQAFSIVDDAPSGYSPATYLLRGIVEGQVTTSSPLSNMGVIASRSVADIQYTGIVSPTDSLFTISWVSVPNAQGYWLQVYQFLEAQQTDQIISGVPAPMYLEQNRDYFVGYVAAPATSYKLGDPNGAEILHTKIMVRGQTYLVRIAAVDVEGRLIAFTYGDFGVAFAGDGYALFPLGAQSIEVRAADRGPRLAPAAVLPPGVDLMMGDLPIVRRR